MVNVRAITANKSAINFGNDSIGASFDDFIGDFEGFADVNEQIVDFFGSDRIAWFQKWRNIFTDGFGSLGSGKTMDSPLCSYFCLLIGTI